MHFGGADHGLLVTIWNGKETRLLMTKENKGLSLFKTAILAHGDHSIMFLVMLGPDENGCELEKVWPSFLVFSCMLVEIGNKLLWLIFFLKIYFMLFRW